MAYRRAASSKLVSFFPDDNFTWVDERSILPFGDPDPQQFVGRRAIGLQVFTCTHSRMPSARKRAESIHNTRRLQFWRSRSACSAPRACAPAWMLLRAGRGRASSTTQYAPLSSLAHIYSVRPSPRRVCLTGGALLMPATVRAAEGEVAAKCATVALTASRVRRLRPQQLPQSTHELPKGARYPFAHRRTRGPPYSTKASRRLADVRRSLPFSLRTAGARREECRVCPPIVLSSRHSSVQ